MSSEWPLNTLSALCSLIADCPHSTPVWTDDGVVVLRNQNIKGGRLDLSAPSYTDESNFQKRIKRAQPSFGDIVITREAPMGDVCAIPKGLRCCLGQRQVLLRPDAGKVNSRFLLFVLQSPYVQNQIGWNEGTGSTVSNLRIPVLEALKIPTPPVEIQDEIAVLLGGLDDRIALLRETNATLEAMAQALFKSWFVDFDPVHANAGTQAATLPPELQTLFPATFTETPQGLVPEGWTLSRVEDLLELAYGKALKATDRTEGPVPVYGSGGITGSHNQALVNNPSIIVGRKGTVGSLYWEDRPFFPIDTVFYVKTEKSLSFCFYLLQTLGLEGMNTDGAVPGLNRNNVYRLPIVTPCDAVFKAFDEAVVVIRRRIFTNNTQAQTLATLRDTLLPRLISGQLRLPDADAALAEVV